MTTTRTTFSNSLRINHLALLYITTCGLYFFYWFYKNNKQLYEYRQVKNQPLLRTLGLCVPILNIYFLWVFFRDLKKFTFEAGITAFKYPGWLTVAFVIFSSLYRLPSLYSFLGFISLLPIVFAQTVINAYWKKEQPGLPERNKLVWQEIVVCVLGFTLLVLAIIGAGLPPQD